MDNVFEGGVWRFASVTHQIWLGSMIFVYVVGGQASVNQWSALASLAALPFLRSKEFYRGRPAPTTGARTSTR